MAKFKLASNLVFWVNSIAQFTLLMFFVYQLNRNILSNFSLLLVLLITILILQNVINVILASAITLSFWSLILSNSTLNSFIFGQNYVGLLYTICFSYFFFALLVKKVIDNPNINDKVKIDATLVISTILFFAFANFLFRLSDTLKPAETLRFLVLTGEDNSAWLNALSSIQESRLTGTFAPMIGNDVRPTTHLLLALAQNFFTIGLESNVQSNLLVLQKLYLAIIFATVFILLLTAQHIFSKLEYNSVFSLFTILIIGISSYFSLASFAMFGHLTTLISIFLLTVMLCFLSMSKFSNGKAGENKFLILVLSFLQLFAAANAWWPLMPVLFFFLLVLLVEYVPTSKKLMNSIKNFKFIFLLIFIGLFLVWLISKYIFNPGDYLISWIKNFSNLIHIPGGTLSPSNLQIIFFSISMLTLLVVFNKNYNNFSFTVIRATFISISLFYCLIIIFSNVTAPYSVDYAGQKFGLFLIALSIPFEIALISFLIRKFILKNSDAFLFLIFGFLMIFFAGSPTNSQNASWNQAIYPYALINNLKTQDTFVWEGALIDKLENVGNEKRLLCFNAFSSASVSPNDYMCSKFAASLQGNLYQGITQFWFQVNMNVASYEDFKTWITSDFKSDFEFLFIDELISKPENSVINNFTDLVKGQGTFG